MKTELEPFAVDLSNDGIFLWHRKPEKKWEFLGSVPLNTGNLRVQLEDLKKTIQGVDQALNTTVVRLPSAEVQTLTVAHDPNTSDSWESRIVSALEEAADAPIKQLAFDIDRGDGTSDISVAWTPMPVIKQAEAFVRLIGFEPTRYTTDLHIADFPRNPNFQIVDYSTVPEDLSQTDDFTESDEVTSNFETPETPAVQQMEIDDRVTPKTTHSKGDFGFIWFMVMFVIGALLVLAVYFWPEIQRAATLDPLYNSNQLFPASIYDST
jgi:hypothetical protein